MVYSGPTSLDTAGGSQEHAIRELYIRNFEYFLREGGVDCTSQDTVLVITEPVAALYRDEVTAMDQVCRNQHGHSVFIIVRQDVCFDMESARLAVYGNTVNVTSYDNFVFVNCGMSGPSRAAHRPWTQMLTSRLSDNVKMVGITLNCVGSPHVQSMMYALDRVGLSIIMKSGAVYDCRHGQGSKADVIEFYEVAMSRYILDAGYGISGILQNTTVFARDNCDLNDLWTESRLIERFGRIPALEDTVFFKTTRLLPSEIATQISFLRKITWKWK